MKKLMVVFLVFVLVAAFTGMGFAKEDVPSRELRGQAGFASEAVRNYFEGFEGVFPPDGWDPTVTLPSHTWFQSTSAFEGSYGAQVPWQDVTPQYEVLSFDYFIDVAAGEYWLSFATMGSIYWTMNANFTVNVNNGAEELVYDFYSEFTAGSWVWDVVSIDLSGWDQQLVTISFVYSGWDGADHHLDAVSVDDGPPPPPPPFSFCDLVEQPINETGSFSGDTCVPGVNNSPIFIGGGYGAGFENYYEVFMPAGSRFQVNLIFDDPNMDAVIHVVDSCTEPVTALAYYDDDWYVPYENIIFPRPDDPTYPEDRTVILVIDSFFTADPCGPYTFEFVQLEGEPVATELRTLSCVKSIFR